MSPSGCQENLVNVMIILRCPVAEAKDGAGRRKHWNLRFDEIKGIGGVAFLRVFNQPQQ